MPESGSEKRINNKGSATVYLDGHLEKCWEAPIDQLEHTMNILEKAGRVSKLEEGMYKIGVETYLIFER
ncbi:MAG: hypothetical protein ACD_7C00245G0005 [uncultured bacterium]|nr:MAG: hypothetical protein ACD_7C00245G0005 [uncultured bacterium]KKP69071.1 MAG: hypothetical protein UR66_C0002G0128 [Candidatus Moranbacteria bacterium GW2011_GWE1_35_17]KKP81636.1 MAG: hypothetical protein UR83_C0070G0002 [Candidatus Moranbacteria bacterium GW2011_GWF2_35_54]KKP84493.1 MAG: hypothetical protein UR82_C0004G0009 [Candidatus Moranbacteria bacterium GW2011_GWF1_35_5]